jgi:SAM-dependent methyltransferase
MSKQTEAFTSETSNYDSLYAGKASAEGMGLKSEAPPWDIGEAQPALMALEKTGAFTGSVLDAGCGRGSNALYLADRGHRVTGFDISPTAIADAKERARARGLDISFTVADAVRIDALDGKFTTVLDYGLYHCLTDEQRGQYSRALHQICEEGAELHMFSFADVAPPGLPPVWLRVSQDNLHANLGSHWRILSIEGANSTTLLTQEFFEQQRRNAPNGRLPFDPKAYEMDNRGRILLPIWHVHAERI